MAKNTKQTAPETTVGKRKLTKSSAAVIITAAVLLLTIITAISWVLIDAAVNDKWFDYSKSNMNKYVEIPDGTYKDYDLELSIAKPHAIDIDVAILNLISSAEFRKVHGDGAGYTNRVITAGDKLIIRYRGYTKDENGEEKIISSAMSNIPNTYETEIQIGESNTSLPIGFELGLIGKNPADYAKFDKITSGKASAHEDGDEWVIYITAERILTEYVGTDNDKTANVTKLNSTRIDLAADDVDKYFGEGFAERVKGYNIGQEYGFEMKIGEGDKAKNYTYRNFKINFATTCEKDKTADGEILTVEGYFAYDYGVDGTATAGLRNETVYYDVWVKEIVPYDTVINEVNVDTIDDITDDVIKYLINRSGSELSQEELNTYEGNNLVEKYRSYVKKYLDDAYEEALEIMIEDALWSRLLKSAKVLKYPKIKVEEIYAEYEEDVRYQFDYTGGTLQNYDESYTTYDTVDEFARAYLQLEDSADWKKTLYTMSENLVKERLILFYILQNEDMLPSKDALAEKVEQIKAEYFDEYIKQYVAKMQETDEDYTIDDLSEEEYNKFIEERRSELFEYYDDDYFEESAYYDIALEVLIKYPTVYTLDNPKPAVDK